MLNPSPCEHPFLDRPGARGGAPGLQRLRPGSSTLPVAGRLLQLSLSPGSAPFGIIAHPSFLNYYVNEDNDCHFEDTFTLPDAETIDQTQILEHTLPIAGA